MALTPISSFLVESDIPQGSILGPILFSLYINDLLEFCVTNMDATKVYLYADDVKLQHCNLYRGSKVKVRGANR